VRTLVVSDLHLGSRMRRDVLRRPAALIALLEAIADMDRVVLMGDVVEMLEGRAPEAMVDAEPVLREIGTAVGRGREILVIPGNHDHALVRPWLRARRASGVPLGLATRVATTSGPELEALSGWLRAGGARVRVQYPGAWLEPGRVYAHHGHYLDRHLTPRGVNTAQLTSPDAYESAPGVSLAALQGVLGTTLPMPISASIDRAAGLARSVSAAAAPFAAGLVGEGALAPLSAGALGFQFRRRGLPSMHRVLEQLQVKAEHAIFGHLHRAGAMGGDDPGEWALEQGPVLHNSGCWVYEPLLLAGAEPPHPYWPGGAILVEEGRPPRLLRLLDDVPERSLR
jgi:hypothetical protein